MTDDTVIGDRSAHISREFGEHHALNLEKEGDMPRCGSESNLSSAKATNSDKKPITKQASTEHTILGKRTRRSQQVDQDWAKFLE